MEAQLIEEIPGGPGWLYEPKWDGFRCLAFKDEESVILQSKSGQPLGRYFPELVEAIHAVHRPRFVLDGEIVIVEKGRLAFDLLLQRIHPARSRILKLAAETPASFVLFDLLVDEHGNSLIDETLAARRKRLENFFKRTRPKGNLLLSPVIRDPSTAVAWMNELAPSGFDGVIAKRIDANYRAGDRTGMVKIKRMRTADCVVGGFRYDKSGKEIGSLLLGLYNREGKLDHVGFTSSFSGDERKALKSVVLPLVGPPGFTGQAPGGPSRWSTKRSMEWQPLRAGLVCEVRFDHFSGNRFRHGTKFLRWRPDKSPAACTFDQVRPSRRAGTIFKLLRGAG